MAKKKLVLGATGFIGSAVMRELLKDGEEVKVVARKSSNTKNIDSFDVERVYAHMLDTASMRNDEAMAAFAVPSKVKFRVAG